MASMTIDSTVPNRMPSRIAPLTFLATRMPMTTSVTTNTIVGHEAIDPSIPNCTGTVVPAASGTRRTNPASTRPTNAMNRPMPTAILPLSGCGTALNTIVRTPVTTNSSTTMPLTNTSPITAGHVIIGAKDTATSVLSPKPAAIANGKFATTPMRMVITPATRAVTAVTWSTGRIAPVTSLAALGSSAE